jgi:hypothetical protein
MFSQRNPVVANNQLGVKESVKSANLTVNYSCTVHLDIIKVFYLPTDAQ